MLLEAREHALRLLVNREHSYTELYQKLCQKGHDSARARDALDELVQQGYLSDERFTEMFIHSRVRRGYGPIKIIAELLNKQVSDTLIYRYLDQCAADWFSQAEKVRQKKFGVNIPQNYAQRMRQARFLQNRGFSPEHMQQLFD